ncbi:MAG: ABC transporter permease [Bacteroidales bacterium]
MNSLFFKLAFRNIIRNRFHSLINILGLSIGIATILFIFLFVKYETGFDNFHPDGKRIYRLVETWDVNDNHSVLGFSSYPIAPDAKNAIPGIDNFCRVSDAQPVKCFIDGQQYKIEKIRFADINFYSFFSFRLISGNPLTVLNSADKIVLSKKTAKRIFGNKNPIGMNLIINQKTLTVSGISEDMPENTHLKSDALASIKYIEQDKENYWLGWDGGMQFLSYLKLTPGTSFSDVEAKLPDVVYQKIGKKTEGTGFKLKLTLQNIRDVHLSTGQGRYDCPDNRSKSSIMVVGAIGLLILILAIVNYISLYVAQKNEKIKDISLLSIHGADKSQIIVQSYAEVLFLSAISSIAGYILFILLTPVLNSFLNTSVYLKGNIIQSVIFVALLISVLALIITLVSLFSVFHIKTTEALRGNSLPGSRNNKLSNAFVVFQFSLVGLLIVSSLIINRQNKFVLNHDLGFDKENILALFPDKEFKHNELSGFKQELLNIPGVNYVSLSSQGIGQGLTMNGYKITGETGSTLLNVIYTDAEFLECFGVRLTSGRNFKENSINDNRSILVNDKLVKRAGWKDPEGQTIERNGLMTVIGTVEDFNFSSLYSEVKPLIIMCNPAYDNWGYGCINIKYKTSDIQAFVKTIRRSWEKEFPGITYEVSFLNEQIADNYTSLLAQQKLVAFFSIIAIIIACMGLFGLTSFVAIRRTKEIGLRRVSGAKVSEIVFMLNEDFLKRILLSMIIAFPLAWYAMHRWLEGFAYRTGLRWWIFALAGMITLVIVLLTITWQSWKAASRNPVEALRYE